MNNTQALWRSLIATDKQPTAAEYARAARELSASVHPDLLPRRVGVLASCTMQFVDPFLKVECARRGVQVETHYGPFGQFEQQVGNPHSELYAFAPEALVFIMRPDDMNVDVYSRYYDEKNGSAALERVIERITSSVRKFREHCAAPVLVANFPMPAHLPLGPFDANAADSLTFAIAEANLKLRNALAEIAGVTVWDLAGLVREVGARSWSDSRLWALARIPVAAAHHAAVGVHLSRSIIALTRAPAKCIVLDLDNTVWGGIIGDDGIEGIHLGDDHPGNAFKNFQRAVLGLADRGILIAIVSKNDHDVAYNAIQHHPEMLIRAENIAAARINWMPKSANLREIARELNIGLDALVFFDDNPVERAEVRANAPEVKVVDLPADPLGYERALADCGFFDVASISQEDYQRVKMYRQERARDAIRAEAGTVEEFLTGLGMVAEVAAANSSTIGRVAQLLGKTNQFNLTTRRHLQADVARMAEDPDCAVITMRLQDNFGDLGLIAVGILAIEGEVAVIDSFVMSCRAMGREAEVALASELTRVAHERGCTRIIGEYIPTARNGIVADLYLKLGFTPDPAAPESRFVLDLSQATLAWPFAIRRAGSEIPIPTPA